MKVLRYMGVLVVALALLAGGLWYWALHTNSGARWIFAQVDEAVGLRAASITGDFGNGVAVNDLGFANESIDIAVRELTLVVNVDLYPLAVEVVLAAATDIDVRVSSSDDDSGPADPAAVLRGLVLPFPLRVIDLHARGISVDASGEAYRVSAVRLAALWQDSIKVERFEVVADGFDASMDGAIDLQGNNDFSANLRSLVKPLLTDLPQDLEVIVEARGDPATADINARLADFATVTGSASWREALRASAVIGLERVDPQDFVDSWPAGYPVSGRFHVTLDDERLNVTESELLIHGTDALIRSEAEWLRANDTVAGHLRWQNLRWPLQPDEARVRSKAGDLRLAGTVDDWTVSGTIELGTGDYPDGMFVIDAGGTRDSIQGEILDSEIFGGRVAGRVAYSLAGEGPWSAALDVADLQLGGLLPDWPGQVSGRFDSYGNTEPFELHTRLDNVSGKLRGADLRASGALDIAGGHFIARELRIEHGPSNIVLTGSPQEPRGLRIEALVADVREYAEELSGSVRAEGLLTTAPAAASLTVRAESDALSFNDLTFENLEVALDASDERQTLHLAGVHLGTPFGLAVSGAFGNWRKPLETRFEGEIDTFEIDLEDEHTMSLEDAARLAFSTDAAELQDFCIIDGTGAKLCAGADWQKNGGVAADLRFESLPLDILEHAVETGLQMDQRVTGTFDWHRGAERGTGGSGALTITAGTVSRIGDPDSAVLTGDGKLDFDIENGRLLRGDVALPLPGRGTIAGDFAILDVTQGAASGVRGNLSVDVSSIRMLSKLSPLLDSAAGALRATAKLSGSVAAPELTGDLELRDGRFVYLPIGLDVSDVNLRGSMDRDYSFDISGDFRAGDGYGQLESRADYGDADEPGLHFRLSGTDLTLVNVPDVLIKIDPDVEIGLDRETLTINGRLKVPSALIKPTNLSTSRVNESNDVVIVAGELPDAPDEATAVDDFTYDGKLEVSLGDDVVVDLDVARARVRGTTMFDWQGEKIPIADGRYNIAGSIAAFGQVLDVTDGYVNFPKVPANKPHVRIVAERDIFGNTQIKRAGVLVDGPIARPTIEAYTQPLTTEERALTLLVTGSDFDYEAGVGAIDFGTYIAPRLFVSYGVGVFERENVISARYDLSKGFGIKASSGSKESGVDLNYRFEN